MFIWAVQAKEAFVQPVSNKKHLRIFAESTIVVMISFVLYFGEFPIT